MPKNWSERIEAKLRAIAEDPYAQNQNVTKLKGKPGYRLRVGDWRVIYKVIDDQVIILVLKVGPRGEIYR